jgi:hypothetical protein
MYEYQNSEGRGVRPGYSKTTFRESGERNRVISGPTGFSYEESEERGVIVFLDS